MTTSAWGHEWLAAALDGGLPEPHRDRWQPLRVGIVGLWEYDDAEFWFADGRLVLRGGNGAGKTKVLELTTLMLLRGEVSPSVLDPFGSQHRTMRFNLLPTGEGDDPRPPADSGLGYAWAEFGRLDDGEARFFVCGMGMSARRGTGTTGVTTWQFVTGLRPGKELQLAVGGRALEQKELRKLDGVYLPGSAAVYRERLGHELFGLSAASYDNLTDLLKQLRKPKLGERLSPTLLEETLREALPPLATHEVTQLAEGWDHLEALRGAVEQTQQAAVAVVRFVREGWRPWARAVLRQRADEFTQATTALDNTTRDRNEAEKTLAEAKRQVAAAQGELAEAKRREGDGDTQLRELLESASYHDAVAASQRVQELRSAVVSLQGQVTAAERRSADAEQASATAKEWRDRAEEKADDIRGRVAEQEASVREAARSAGLAASVDAHLPGRDLDALIADHQTRLERFERLGSLHDDHAAVERHAERSGQLVQAAEQDAAAAQDDEAQAAAQVERDAEMLRQQIRGWAEAVVVVTCPATLVEDWCDQIGELTVFDAESGATRPGASVVDKMRNHVAGMRRETAGRAEALRLERSPVLARRQEVDSELERVRARTEFPPPAPTLWARRERPGPDGKSGAPLWRLVNPVAGLDGDVLARLEAAAAASGLLDAWVAADGKVDTVDGRLLADVQLGSGGAARGPSLLAVLEPDDACAVEPDVVRGVLAGIAWHDTGSPDDDGDRLSADGSWRVGGLAGRAEPAGPACYLGAAARTAAREREIARLQSELAELDAYLTDVNERIAALDRAMQTLDREEAAIPTQAERELAEHVGRLAERSRRRLAGERNLAEKRTQHQENLTRRDEAWAAFADYATGHHFELRDLPAQGSAIREYGVQVERLSSVLELFTERMKTVGEATRRCTEQEARWKAAVAEADGLTEQHRQTQVRLDTAEETLDIEHAEQLRRKDALDSEITELRKRIDQLSQQWTDAKVDEGTATTTLQAHESQRAAAEQRRDAAMTALWASVDHGLAEPLGLIVPERRAVQAAREFASGVRKDVTPREQATDVDRAWGRCTREVEQLRQRLLPDRDVRVHDEDGDVLPRILVLVDTDLGWLPPPAAADALTERVREQQERFDAEQQRVLTTLLGSAFIEHLKDRLDYTARTFQRINDQLAKHPTRHGHVVRVQWEADPKDPDAGAVVNALRQGYQQLTQERQDMVRDFLRRQIETAREDADTEGAADWKDQLALALDYRRWLRLMLQYRKGAAGTWALFDAAKHAAKSGGEKVVLLAQPLFAAAVVAYDAASGDAPRCVWLDEAMTGVDATVKASFMGLTVDFELDVMLTAHDEWCNYSTVPAVAIYDLARQPNVAGVDSQPYLWCSGELQQLAVDRLGVGQRSMHAVAEGLFAEEAGD